MSPRRREICLRVQAGMLLSSTPTEIPRCAVGGCLTAPVGTTSFCSEMDGTHACDRSAAGTYCDELFGVLRPDILP